MKRKQKKEKAHKKPAQIHTVLKVKKKEAPKNLLPVLVEAIELMAAHLKDEMGAIDSQSLQDKIDQLKKGK